MQLILDAENIDIESNMSTIEHEPLNEKFLANKVIDHLTDDITTGNKENIQKQQNIIQDVEETNIVDTDKETPSGGNDILTNNPDVDKTNEDTVDTEDAQTSEKNIDENSTEKTSEQLQDAVVSENVSKEEFPPNPNETGLEDLNEKELKTKNENDLTSLNKEDPIVEVSSTVKENNSLEVFNEQNEDNKVVLDNEVDISDLSANSIDVSNEQIKDKEVELDNEVDISELSAELNKEKEMDLDKEFDISEVSNELNEEKEMDSDKEDDDIAEVSSGLNAEKEVDLDKEGCILEVSTGLNKQKEMDLDKEDDIVEVSTGLIEEKKMEFDKEENIAVVSTNMNEDNEVDLDKVDDISDVSTELNEEKEMDLDKVDDILDVSTELNEEKEMDLDKEDDIVEVSTGLNEEKEMDLDKEDDILEVSTRLNEEKDMDLDKDDDIVEVSTGLNEEKEVDLVKEHGIAEVSTELNEENEVDLDKEDGMAEVSTIVNENRDMDLNKEDDIAEVSTVLNNKNDNEVGVEKATEKYLEKDSVESEVLNANLNDDSQEGDCAVIERIHEANEKNTAIEIDDKDEKLSENHADSRENIESVPKIVDKNKPDLTKEVNTSSQEDTTITKASVAPVQPKRICRLSNNLDIFSDEEEDDQPHEKSPNDNIQPVTEKQCINIDDDDDIMLIDEDLGAKDNKKQETTLEVNNTNIASNSIQSVPENTQNILKPSIETKQVSDTIERSSPSIKENKDTIVPTKETSYVPVIETDKTAAVAEEKEKIKKPLLPNNFLVTCKKNLSDMTRNDLEEFCILKIVESIVDRSNLGEIKAHLKNLTQTIEDCKKKCLILTKQNKDLQVVLKSVQEEQKSGSDVHITPLKITRSVGMQVMMVAEKNAQRRKPANGVGGPTPQGPVPNNNTKQVKNQQAPNTRNQKEKVTVNQQIPVPRLVPATPPQPKTNPCATNTPTKPVNNTVLPNGIRNSPPVQKVEKRPRSQAITVDLTDDEPPAKLQNVQRGPVTQTMRVLTTGPNIVPAPRFAQNINSPRKVYIPISGPQAQGVRPGQTIMLKTLSGLGPRPRAAAPPVIPKAPTSSPMRFGRGQPSRHPAPLPDAMKQYQPPNWKSLPPAPDLKLSKVENGIVISWKIDDYQEDNHEEIASYQLYAYQETSSPPNTALWKKIGDVKALPLPMACTLTQFMAGYKYYFAVRAVDIRSRYGPFSSPSSILLLNKM